MPVSAIGAGELIEAYTYTAPQQIGNARKGHRGHTAVRQSMKRCRAVRQAGSAISATGLRDRQRLESVLQGCAAGSAPNVPCACCAT